MSAQGRRILAFFESAAPDDRGRYFDEVLRFDDAALEYTHDFIQWLFPTRERSGANPDAPRLDDDAIAVFRSTQRFQTALRRGFDRMLAFYGLQCDGDSIVPGHDFAMRSHWLTRGNHNHLRLTRILTSTHTLGLEQEACALLACLLAIVASQRHAISETTVRYWKSALRPSPGHV